MTKKQVDTAIIMIVGPCIDDTDFKTLEEGIAYNAAGMDISLIIEKTDGTSTTTAITLTTGGTSDWTHKDGGYYEVEITAAQNAEEGIAYLRGVCTGVLPFESSRYEIVEVVGSSPTVVQIRTEMDTNSTKMAPSQTLADYKATGFSVPNEYDTVIAALQTDLNNTNQYKATGFSVPNEYDTVIAALQTDLDNPNQYKATGFATATALTTHDGKLDDVHVLINRVLGLNQENFFIDNTTYSGVHMTGARLRIYSVAGSVGSVSDVIGTYTITATYSGDEMTDYKVVKV